MLQLEINKIELLECPFCGKVHPAFSPRIINEDNSYFVECSCGARTGNFRTYQSAADAWNRRPKTNT